MLNYTTYVSALQTLAASTAPDVPFATILPDAIDYAELRIIRELDLLSTVVSDTSVSLTSGSRNATLNNAFVVTNGINVLTPAGSNATTGSRVPLTNVSRDVLDLLWPSGASNNGVPTMWAFIDQWNIILGPAPDAAYLIETVGTQRPVTLSATTPTTFLTLYLPDLFLAASMVFMSGYQRNFSAAGNDPQMAVNWETQYGKLFSSAGVEEARKRWSSSGWTSAAPQPLAGTPR